MSAEQWPLVAFTVLVQGAAGFIVAAELACLAGGVGADALLRRREQFGFAMAALGLGLSFAHLGAPLHSPYALLNIGSSWLSREILCTSLFVAALAALTAARVGLALAGYTRPLAAVACVLGAATVFAMSRVYAIVTVPAWNTPATLIDFAGTALLLGALAAGLLAFARRAAAPGALTRLSLVLLALAVLALGLKLVGIPLSLLAGLGVNAHGNSAIAMVLSDGVGLFALRLLLLVSGAALFLHAAAGALGGRMAALPVLAASAFAAVLAGELLGRFTFFGMHLLHGL